MSPLLVFIIVVGSIQTQDFNPLPLNQRQQFAAGFSGSAAVSPNSIQQALSGAVQELNSPVGFALPVNQVRPFTAESLQAILQAPDRRVLRLRREQRVFETATNILSNEIQRAGGAAGFAGVPGVSGFSLPDTSVQEFLSGEEFLSCRAAYNTTVCDPNSPYRAADGSCNNLENVHWGRSATCFPRLLPPSYGDGRNTLRQGLFGAPLPNPREISLKFHTNTNRQSDVVSHMHMQFGQFLDHDITLTPFDRSEDNTPVECCPRQEVEPVQCAAIDVSSSDHYFSKFNQRCLSFVRSFPCPSCTLGSRQQMNQQTSYIDGSHIYGAFEDLTASLRTFADDGKLEVLESRAGPLLPQDLRDFECMRPERNQFCFLAGDQRVNEQPGLTCLHTVFVRHHNNIAETLKELNPDWDEERIFQEARRIVGAQLQMIVYNEYLPPLLGERRMGYYSLWVDSEHYTEYDPTINPSLVNEFSAAAFRFGHSMINAFFTEIGERYYEYGHHLRDIFFNPFELYEGRLEPFIRGFIEGRAQNFDRYMAPDVTNYLYRRAKNQSGLDLAAFNIQRGRDHGIPGYTSYVEFCDGPRIDSFPDLNRLMTRQNVHVLEDLYSSVHDLDLFTGGLAERPRHGSILGPTFTCIISIQFYHLKYGDRFYFEHQDQAGSFAEEQLSEIRKTTLARILCDTTTISEICPEVMKYPNARNVKAPCSELPEVDLHPWEE